MKPFDCVLELREERRGLRAVALDLDDISGDLPDKIMRVREERKHRVVFFLKQQAFCFEADFLERLHHFKDLLLLEFAQDILPPIG